MGQHAANRQPHVSLNVDIAELVRMAEELRAQTAHALEALSDKLAAASATDDDVDFAGLMKASQQLLQLDDLEMSRTLKVSRPTIGRWIRGVSVPHTLARNAIFNVLGAKARTKAKSLRG